MRGDELGNNYLSPMPPSLDAERRLTRVGAAIAGTLHGWREGYRPSVKDLRASQFFHALISDYEGPEFQPPVPKFRFIYRDRERPENDMGWLGCSRSEARSFFKGALGLKRLPKHAEITKEMV